MQSQVLFPAILWLSFSSNLQVGEPIQKKLVSPRETLQTLYYAVDVYDYAPQVIEEAIATMDLGDLMPPDSASAALLAVQLETIINSLDIPLVSVSDKPDGDTCTLHDAEGITITMRRGPDKLWRFDRNSIERIPSMRRIVLAKQKNLQAERATLREGFTDARATMKRFLNDCFRGDFTAAAQALDLSGLSTGDRREKGPILAQQLAFVLQRRGYVFSQLIPDNPNASPFTWHADRDGRIVLERVHPSEGKDSWLISRQTIANLDRMYMAALPAQADLRYVRLNRIVPKVDGSARLSRQKPKEVPAVLGSPRALLMGFFRTMDEAESNDERLADALTFLDLQAIPPADRNAIGTKLVTQLEAILRKLQVDLATMPVEYDALPVVLGEARGLKVELSRGEDGAWRFSESTVSQIPTLFEKLDARDRADRDQVAQFDTARETMVSFLAAVNTGDGQQAGKCLDLSDFNPGARDEVGPVLAIKLKYVMDRIGRIYIQEVPDEADGPRYVVHRSELGKIVIAKRSEEPRKGAWLFTADTVERIEKMFRMLADRPPAEAVKGVVAAKTTPDFSTAPGLWVRLHLPEWIQRSVFGLDLYQWAGLAIAIFASWWIAVTGLAVFHRIISHYLQRSGSSLTTTFVRRTLRPLTWLAALSLGFHSLSLLDLPVSLANDVMPAKKFLLAALIGWLGCRLVDFFYGVYSNSEFLRPHRSLGDMIAPVTVRAAKGVIVILMSIYIIYQVGEGELLSRFLTGLGVAGLAASLAAQDALKSFFGTLLLIGERSFKIGDRIIVAGQEGVVEQVGFRSTRLRTPNDSVLTIPNSTIASAAIDNRGLKPAKSSAAA